MKRQNDNLIQWLADEKSTAYFGGSFSIRADVLASVITGQGNLAEIGRKHGVSRQAVHRHAVKARAIYFPPSTSC
jgi:transposase-like protein